MWFDPLCGNCASITSLRKCGCENELRKSPRCELRRRREARPPSRKPINAATPSVARRTEEHAESYNKGFGGIHYSDSPPGSMYKLNEAIQFDINDDCWASDGERLSGETEIKFCVATCVNQDENLTTYSCLQLEHRTQVFQPGFTQPGEILLAVPCPCVFAILTHKCN